MKGDGFPTVTSGGQPILRKQQALQLPFDQLAFDLGDRLGRVEAFRAGLRAIHDGVAAIEPERILEIVEPLAGRLVARVVSQRYACSSAAGPRKRPSSTNSSGTRSSSRRTGCTRRGRRASRGPRGSAAIPSRGVGVVGLQPGLDRGVLGVEIGQVRHQVLDHRLMRQRIDRDRRRRSSSMPWCRRACWCRRCSSRRSRTRLRGRSGGRSASDRSCS